MTRTASDILECLVRLPEDRARSTRRLEEFLQEDSAEFVRDATLALRDGSVSRDAAQALYHILDTAGLLFTLLQEIYSADLQRSRKVLAEVSEIEPRLTARLTQRLSELLDPVRAGAPEEILFCFDAIAQMNGVANLAPAVAPLRASADPRLRARSVVLSALLPNGRHMLELFHDETDPRVRANLVEYQWLSTEKTARLIYEEARRDPQHRVHAAGLLGLYRLGEPRALTGLVELADSPKTLSRAAARWALEILREPRLQPHLEKLRKEFGGTPVPPHPAFPAPRDPRHKFVVWVPRMVHEPRGWNVQFAVLVDGEDPLDTPVRTLDMRTWLNGEPVLTYSLQHTKLSRRLAIGMVLPVSLRADAEKSQGVRATLDMLASMTDGELRGAAFYRSGLFLRTSDAEDIDIPPEMKNETNNDTVRTPVFAPDGFLFAADIKVASSENCLATKPGLVTLAMLNRLKAMNQPGHIVVVLNQAIQHPPDAQRTAVIEANCRETGSQVHVILLGSIPEETHNGWQKIARSTGGIFKQLESENELAEQARLLMLYLRDSYTLEFDAPAEGGTLRIVADHEQGRGKVELHLGEQLASAARQE